VAGIDALCEAYGDLWALCHGRGRGHAGVELLNNVELGGNILQAEGSKTSGVDVGVDVSSAAVLLI
jgi:hypothetical protein